MRVGLNGRMNNEETREEGGLIIHQWARDVEKQREREDNLLSHTEEEGEEEEVSGHARPNTNRV